MRSFTKTIKRTVTLRSGDPTLGDTEFVLKLGPLGVEVSKKHTQVSRFLTWRAVIGFALTHAEGRKGPSPAELST